MMKSVKKAFKKLTRRSSNDDEHGSSKTVVAPKPWKHKGFLTTTELNEQRKEFWRNAPTTGGDPVFWELLHDAIECYDIPARQLMVNTFNIQLGKPDMSVCLDEQGTSYLIPKHVLSAPTNLNKKRLIDRIFNR